MNAAPGRSWLRHFLHGRLIMGKLVVEPGIYYDIPFSRYCEIDAINASALGWGLNSARHIRAFLDGEIRQESDDMRFGRALHAALLEPEEYQNNWLIASGCQAELKSGNRKGKECGSATYSQVDGKWLCAAHRKGVEKSKIIVMDNAITVADSNRVDAACESLKQEPAMKLIRARGGCEVTVVCDLTAEDLGVDLGDAGPVLRCKIRIDKLVPAAGILPNFQIDLKKVQHGKAGTEEFQWSIYRYGYDLKAAFYRIILKKATGEDSVFVWVAIEDKAPHCINVIQCDADTAKIGEMRLRECLTKYAHGIKTGEWPGHLNIPRPVQGGLPESIKRKYLGGLKRR